jgi:hypothetical protein
MFDDTKGVVSEAVNQRTNTMTKRKSTKGTNNDLQ